eukprot:358524-Chlamydomonas_euryale.AAC.4
MMRKGNFDALRNDCMQSSNAKSRLPRVFRRYSSTARTKFDAKMWRPVRTTDACKRNCCQIAECYTCSQLCFAVSDDEAMKRGLRGREVRLLSVDVTQPHQF